MSELIRQATPRDLRTRLLSTVSSGVFAVLLAGTNAGLAADADRPTVWIEFGADLNRIVGQPDPFLPQFTPAEVQFGLPSPAVVQRLPKHGFGEEAKVELDPTGSNWVVSAAIRYGRATRKQYLHQELTVPPLVTPGGGTRQVYRNLYHPQHRTADYTSKIGETYTIADFSAGRDVGIGLLGQHATSQLNFGVRFAQLSSTAELGLQADPNPHFVSQYVPRLHRVFPAGFYYQWYRASPTLDHSFQGIGPSLSWNETMGLSQGDEDTGLDLDWGMNFAVLFGRQKVTIQHHTSSDRYVHFIFRTGHTGLNQYGIGQDHYSDFSIARRSRSVVSPNVGGFASLSFRMPNAKVSLGYRADFFFGAMDSGIDATRTSDAGFHGPFATVSIGLGG